VKPDVGKESFVEETDSSLYPLGLVLMEGKHRRYFTGEKQQEKRQR
jgi:hypothetical protein